jgi:hypothetical protein
MFENLMECALITTGLLGLLLMIHGIGLIWEGITEARNRKRHGMTGCIGRVVGR